MTTPDIASLPSIDELTAQLANEDAAFTQWRDSVPDNHWAKKDLSALRIGYELGKAALASPAGEGGLPEQVCNMRICEVPHIILRRDQLYRFTVDPNCEQCRAAANAYGASPDHSPDAGKKVDLPLLPQLTGGVGLHESGQVLFTGLQVQEYARAYGEQCRLATPEQPGSSVQGDSLRMPTADWVRIVQQEPTDESPYACGYQTALAEVAKVLGTPPPAPAAEQGECEDCKWNPGLCSTHDASPPIFGWWREDGYVPDNAGCGIAEMLADGYKPLALINAPARNDATQPEARGVEGMVLPARRENKDSYLNAVKLLNDGFNGCLDEIGRLNATLNPVRAEQPEGQGAGSGINPAFWIQAIRTNAHCTDCTEKLTALLNAADHMERYIAAAPAAPGAAVGVDALPFTDTVIDTMQAKMADHGFAVPVRVISEAFTAALAGKAGA